MPGEIQINVDVSEVDSYFDAIADPARVKKITRKALRKGAEVTQVAIEARIPVRPELPSGTALPPGAMKSDVVIRSSTDDNGVEMVSIQPGALTDHVAGMVEFGHRMVAGGRSQLNRKTGTTKGPGHTVATYAGDGFVPAKGYYRQGAEESSAAAADAIVESLSADAVNLNAPSSGDTQAA